MKPKVNTYFRYTTACPAQWYGVLQDGRTIYVRYRFGSLTVGIGTNQDDAVEAQMNDTNSDVSFHLEIGGEFEGKMHSTTMKKITGDFLDWSEARCQE